MKFSLLLTLAVFFAFQVHFILSGKKSWNSRVRLLKDLNKQTKRSVENLTKFYRIEILNYANNTILDLSISAVDNVTKAMLLSVDEVERFVEEHINTISENGTEFLDTLAYIENLSNYLLRTVENNYTFFGECANSSLEKITRMQKKLEQESKFQIKLETLNSLVINATEYVEGSCRNIRYDSDAELCLACRQPRIEMASKSIKKYVEKFKRTSLKAMEEVMQEFTNCKDINYSSLMKKILEIKKNAYKCIIENERTCFN